MKPQGHRIERQPIHRPRCDAHITPDNQSYEWRMGHAKRHPSRYPHPWQQCVRKARYHISGSNLCTQHAGLILLDTLFPPPGETARGWRIE